MNRQDYCYFCLLLTPRGSYIPLTMDNGGLAWFYTITEAREAALTTPLGGELGFEVHEVGRGVYSE